MRMPVVVTLLLLSVNPALARPPGGANEPATTATWYAPKWLMHAPHVPVFQVRDTLHKYGRYADKTKAITLKDLIKFHGHLCGGLVEAAAALKAAFDVIFPDRVVDRTDLRVVSSNSACGVTRLPISPVPVPVSARTTSISPSRAGNSSCNRSPPARRYTSAETRRSIPLRSRRR